MWHLTPAEFGCPGRSGLWSRWDNDWVLSSCFRYRGIVQARTSNTSGLIYSACFLLGKGQEKRQGAREETAWEPLYRRGYPQVPVSSSSSVICQLARAPRTYPNRQQSSWECSSNNPYTPYITSEIEVTNKL